jgi:spoIIIJ-associated protein
LNEEVVAPEEERRPEPGQAQALMGRLLSLLGVTAEIEEKAGAAGELVLRVRVTAGGEEIGLTGEHPLLQEPVSYLVNKMLSHPPSRSPPVLLDFSGEDLPTDEEMTRLGQFLGERAMKLGKVLVVGPMAPRDRRAIHLALKEMPGVSSRSEGDGSLRRLLVVPDQIKGPPTEG